MSQSILLVEDNVKLAKLLEQCLVHNGYTVNRETQGDKAIYRILREQPDLVILDIMLPTMNGKQICETVRNEYRGKILMLTALDDIQSEVDSLNLGADGYLTKPVAEPLLLAHITALLRRPNLPRTIEQIQFDSLEINFVTRQVSLLGLAINLSPAEFEIFSLLVINHDFTLSRDNIMQILRGREYDGVDRTIDIRISQLRKKLGDNINKPYRIKTIHGKGYMFISSAWKT